LRIAEVKVDGRFAAAVTTEITDLSTIDKAATTNGANRLHRRISPVSFNSAAMSSSHAPTSPPSEGGDPQTVVYDPRDPFWRDTEDDDDDMDYQPAVGGSEEDEDEEGDISFHGKYMGLRNW
jgi:hypothetical protein